MPEEVSWVRRSSSERQVSMRRPWVLPGLRAAARQVWLGASSTEVRSPKRGEVGAYLAGILSAFSHGKRAMACRQSTTASAGAAASPTWQRYRSTGYNGRRRRIRDGDGRNQRRRPALGWRVRPHEAELRAPARVHYTINGSLHKTAAFADVIRERTRSPLLRATAAAMLECLQRPRTDQRERTARRAAVTARPEAVKHF